MKRSLTAGALALTMLAAAPPPRAAADPLEVDGFAWAENLTFDGRGSLFVSDSQRGEIVRIRPSGEGYDAEVILDGFGAFLGLAFIGRTLYAVGSEAGLGAEPSLFALDPDRPQSVEVVATFPKSLNGLTADAAGFLYATTEGSFIPGEGEVYRIDPTNGQFWSIISGKWAVDGIAIDPTGNLLYAAEVVSGVVWVYDLRSDEVLGSFQGLNGLRISWLDDFTFGDDPSVIYGADFARGTVVRIPVNQDLRGPPDVLARGFAAPTSTAFGRGPGFPETSLYVTEGGGLSASVTDRRVVEIPNAR